MIITPDMMTKGSRGILSYLVDVIHDVEMEADESYELVRKNLRFIDLETKTSRDLVIYQADRAYAMFDDENKKAFFAEFWPGITEDVDFVQCSKIEYTPNHNSEIIEPWDILNMNHNASMQVFEGNIDDFIDKILM